MQIVKKSQQHIWWFVVVAITVASFIHLPLLTVRDIGLQNSDKSAFSIYSDVNTLVLRAHNQLDLCGLRIDTAPSLVWSFGGYAYLHRNVPIYWNEATPRTSGNYNYEILPTATSPGLGTIISSNGSYSLIRLYTDCIIESNSKLNWNIERIN